MDYLIQTLFISLQYAFSCVSWIFIPIFCIKGICIYLIKKSLINYEFYAWYCNVVSINMGQPHFT